MALCRKKNNTSLSYSVCSVAFRSGLFTVRFALSLNRPSLHALSHPFVLSLRLFFFSLFNFIIMSVLSFPVYYQYVCPVFGAISVFLLPSGLFLHHCHVYNVHFISELP